METSVGMYTAIISLSVTINRQLWFSEAMRMNKGTRFDRVLDSRSCKSGACYLAKVTKIS